MSDYISFPGLGIEKLKISREVFRIGDFPIYWYGLLIGLGLALALVYAFKRAKYFKIDVDRMIDVVMVSTLLAMVGARLYYILFDTELRAEFFKNPAVFLNFRKGGLAIYGGIIFGFITAFWMCKVRKVEILALFDIAGLGFLIGQGIGRWGNFFNQEAFGGNTSLPWGMTGSIIQANTFGGDYDPSKLVHPTFFYEFLWCLLGFILIHIISKKAYKFRGQLFAMYLMWYGLGRAMIESLRTDSLMAGQIRISQLVAILSVIGGLALFMLFKSMHNRSPKDLFADPVLAEGEDVEDVIDDLNEDGDSDRDFEDETDIIDDIEDDEADTKTDITDDFEDDDIEEDVSYGEEENGDDD